MVRKRKKTIEFNEVHNVVMEFSAECDRRTLDNLLLKIGKLLNSAGIQSIYVKDDYSVDYVSPDDYRDIDVNDDVDADDGDKSDINVS